MPRRCFVLQRWPIVLTAPRAGFWAEWIIAAPSTGRAPAQGFDGFDECPGLAPEAFAEAKEAFDNRASERYGKMAPIIGRLAEALARDGRFAVEDRILDVAIALERMYELDGGEISHKLRTRAAWFIGADAESRVREIQAVKAFCEA